MWQQGRWKWRGAPCCSRAPSATRGPPPSPLPSPLILTTTRSDKIRASYEHYAKRLTTIMNDLTVSYKQISLPSSSTAVWIGEAKNVIRKLFPRPGETSLANALRSALRPGEFKMTSMGRWLLVASLTECVDILWVSNTTWLWTVARTMPGWLTAERH